MCVKFASHRGVGSNSVGRVGNYDDVLHRFARFRDVREHVHNFQAVVASCLVLAAEDISAAMVDPDFRGTKVHCILGESAAVATVIAYPGRYVQFFSRPAYQRELSLFSPHDFYNLYPSLCPVLPL